MTAPAAPLTCAGCGTEGRRSTIVWDRSAPEAQRLVLAVTFDWHPDRRPALLCPACRKRLARHQKRRAKAGLAP